MIKKSLAYLAVLCLVVSLAGCGGSANGGQAEDNAGAADTPEAAVEQGKPAEQSEPAEQDEPAEQGEPTEQDEPAEQGESAEQGEPEEPAETPAEPEVSAEQPAGNGETELQDTFPADSDIVQALIVHNHESAPESEFEAASFIPLATGLDAEDDSLVTVYVMALYQGYNISSGTAELVSAASGPAALTFRRDAGGFQLTAYWEPEDGANYQSSLREKFPATIPESSLDTQLYIAHLSEECDAQVRDCMESQAA